VKTLGDFLSKLPPITIVEGEEESPRPSCPNNCVHGWVSPEFGEDVSLDDPRRGKLVPCQVCEEGFENLRMQWQRRIKSGELPDSYRKANLENWRKSVGNAIQGKILAYLTAIEFVQHPKHFIPSHALAQRVEDFMGNDAPAWVGKILSEPDIERIGFVLQGEVGTGKTWLAAATMNALTDMGESVLYMRAQDIIRALTGTWKTNESDEGLLMRFKTVPFLFIDDMNLELRGDALLPHQKDYMEAIIRHRSNFRLPSFITCNITLEQFYEQWGSRIADVIAADLQWVKMGGAKLRQTQQEWGEL
jgi:DNA replication protein DnaC